MKKMRSIIAVIVLLIGGVYYGAQYLLGINLYTMFLVDDVTAPVIDVSEIPSKLIVGQDFEIPDLTCDDDYDTICEVTVNGTIDTSDEGIQSFTVYAKDSSGNEVLQTVTIEIVGGVDGSFYIPDGYYDSIDGLSGDTLKDALNDIITGHTELPYTDTDTDVWDMLREADEDPENPENVIMFYSGFSWPKECQDTTVPPDYCEDLIDGEMKVVEWNREHIWSKSRGDFEIKEGTTSVLDMGAHTDGHHLVAAERRMNSTKNNRMFEDCHDGDDENVKDIGFGNFTCNEWEFEPRDEVKGDVARMIFYMAVRYEGEEGDQVDLEVINDAIETKGSKLPFYGDLNDLLRWHMEDPVSEWEIERNQVIFTYQGNRNPFIDMPELVEMIFGEVQ